MGILEKILPVKCMFCSKIQYCGTCYDVIEFQRYSIMFTMEGKDLK